MLHDQLLSPGTGDNNRISHCYTPQPCAKPSREMFLYLTSPFPSVAAPLTGQASVDLVVV